MDHVAFTPTETVAYFVAENHIHVVAIPGFSKADWIATAVEAMGPNFGDLFIDYTIHPDGTEDWLFGVYDLNMTHGDSL